MAKVRAPRRALEAQGIVAVAATIDRRTGLPQTYVVAKIVPAAKLAVRQATFVRPTGKLLAKVRSAV